MNKRQLAAYMMMFSGIAHLLQLALMGTDDPDTVNGSLFGSTFILVSLLLFTRWRLGLWVGVVWPLIMGLGASYRIVALSPTPQTYLFTLIDFAVVALCLMALRETSATDANT